ncbi:MAG TPA: hypothetical protein VIW01_06190 [Dehalococcoidia bacterium]
MANEREDGPGFTAVRLITNLGALAVAVATIVLIVATIIAEMD